jgi:hypothetical protein
MFMVAAGAALLIVAAGGAQACQICAQALAITPGQQLDAADQAVLAMPLPGERFRIVAIVKGQVANGIIAEEVLRVDAATLRAGKPLLLLRDKLVQRWSSMGSIDAEHAGWLRQLTATGQPLASWPRPAQTLFELTEIERRRRLALVLPYLEHPEPLAAEIAHGEVSRAPYPTLRSLKPQLHAAKIAQWIDDPRLVARRSTFTLLLGIAGGRDDATRLEHRIDAALRSRDATDLAAMLAADLELRGPSRVDWIEQAYFTDRTRTLPEIESALLALGVHGAASAAVPRARVIEAYRLFIRERKAMAGFVAQQLADWECWDATADYVALLQSDALQDPSSHFAVVNYLQRSPRASAKAALQSMTDKTRIDLPR